jgi:hypothetical protein
LTEDDEECVGGGLFNIDEILLGDVVFSFHHPDGR